MAGCAGFAQPDISRKRRTRSHGDSGGTARVCAQIGSGKTAVVHRAGAGLQGDARLFRRLGAALGAFENTQSA
jgi:hypothetical protein